MTTNMGTDSVALPGWIAATYCVYNGHRLGPYYVRRWKKNGKLHKQYIKPSDLERIRAACEAHRQRRKRQIACNKELTVTAGNLNYLLRMVKRSVKGKLRREDHDFLAILEKQGPSTPGRPSLRGTRNFMVPSVANADPTPVRPSFSEGGTPQRSTLSAQRSDPSPKRSTLSAHRSESDRNTATPQYRNTDPSRNRSTLSAQRSDPSPKPSTLTAQRFPSWLTPALTETLLAQIPQTPPTYSQTSLQEEECFRPPKPRKVIKYMLGPRDAKEWKLVGRSEPDEKGIVHENYIALGDDWTENLPPEERQGEVRRSRDGGAHHPSLLTQVFPPEERQGQEACPERSGAPATSRMNATARNRDEWVPRKADEPCRPNLHHEPDAKPTFKTTIGDPTYDLPTPPAQPELATQPTVLYVELAGPDYHARHSRRPIDLSTGLEVED